MANIEFFKHNIGAREIKDVSRTLRQLFLTTGRNVEEFERAFAAYLGLPYAVGVTSCTAALQLSLTALGVGQGDEVITTPMSFSATALAAIQASAVPVFVDVEPDTGNIDASLVEKAITRRTKAILPVHLYGQMCDMRALRAIADCHGLAIVEDAAHALEARRDGVRVGELGDAACFSFYPTKSITCGEGGAVALKSGELDAKLRSMRHHGMNKSASDRYGKDDVTYEITMMGWKYNMDNIQAAMLLGQLERAEKFLSRRERLARFYSRKLSGVPGIKFMKELDNSRHGRHLFTVLVPPDKRAGFVRRMKERGIGVSINYIPIHLQKFFRDTYGYKKGDFPAAEAIGDSTVSLPLYPKLKQKEAETVVETVKEIACELKFSDF
jgi:dTDP-4-amino-4,6-dideoxygalactose transaminase